MFSNQNFPRKDLHNCTYRCAYSGPSSPMNILQLKCHNAEPSENVFLKKNSRLDAGPGKRVELTIFIINVRGLLTIFLFFVFAQNQKLHLHLSATVP